MWVGLVQSIAFASEHLRCVRGRSLEAALRYRGVALYLARENSSRCMHMSAEPGRKAPGESFGRD